MFVFILPIQSFAEIRVPMTFPGRDELILDIIELAMEKSGESKVIAPSADYYSDARQVEELRQGNLDLIWAGASSELQEQLQAIKLPIFKGLSGYRTFVIAAGTQDRFDGIDSIASLKGLKAGLGRFWSDTLILEASGINVIKPVKADSLFHMLDGGRFDYMPLGMHESHDVITLQNGGDVNLALEQNLILAYPLAMYFYVQKDNYDLYNKLNDGMEMAISDGSYDELFYNSPLIVNALVNSNISKREIIYIDNPILPNDVPLERTELWLDINK